VEENKESGGLGWMSGQMTDQILTFGPTSTGDATLFDIAL